MSPCVSSPSFGPYGPKEDGPKEDRILMEERREAGKAEGAVG